MWYAPNYAAMAYSVVEFLMTREVEVVPSTWISDTGTECAWPPFKFKSNVRRAVIRQFEPKKDW